MDEIISNGKALFDHITKFDHKAWKAEHKRIGNETKEWREKHYTIYSRQNKKYRTISDRLKQENPNIERIWEHPELKALNEVHNKDQDMLNVRANLERLGNESRNHLKQFDEARKQIVVP